METTDFGPYRGTQTFNFAASSGVELLWGENGRGKTSFLNALRWALFERVLGRNSAEVEASQVGNREDGATADARPFKVMLTFEHDGRTYRLTRGYAPDARGSYKTNVSLVRDGDVLGPDDREQVLGRLLPEQIARFFLFDAELLQEYEQLLTSGSDAGDKLKEAIERLLGLPVLTRARDDVGTELNSARKAQARAAQSDKTTKWLGQQLQLANDEVEQGKTNVTGLVHELELATNDVNEVERKLAVNGRFKGLLATRDAKKKELEQLEERVAELTEDFTTAASSGLWRAVLAPTIEDEIRAIQDADDALAIRLDSELVSRLAHDAVRDGNCAVCRQVVDEEASLSIQAHWSSAEDVDALRSEMSGLRARRDALRGIAASPEVLLRIEQELFQARVDRADTQGQLDGLQAQLDEAPSGTEATVAQLVDDLKQHNTLVTNTKARLQEAREALQRSEQAVISLSEKLRGMGAPGSGSADRKVALLVELHALLVAAVDDFRDQLRYRIESEATTVFRALTAEPDYDRLRINDNYGLTILHADGSEVLNRSSGYEHVVAVSLIAALQRCSSLSGPIITDSPFGRLDRTHKEHVLKTLPKVSEQVLLLVHDDELDRQVALQVLGTELTAEHHLRRINSRHTEIEAGAHP